LGKKGGVEREEWWKLRRRKWLKILSLESWTLEKIEDEMDFQRKSKQREQLDLV
jgi:hypothetical protein